MKYIQSDLTTRVSWHAALADAHRLQIVDLLGVSDLSPQQLQKRLGLRSNLLAHHLKVLETAGVISRSRSEGDRRRSYVRLSMPIAPTPSTVAPTPVARVIFVCTANSARSQLAEHLWRARSTVPAASAGMRPADSVADGARRVAAAHGLDLSSARPRLLSDVAGPGDLRITVCDNAHEALGGEDPHWSIADPVAASRTARSRETDTAPFELAYAELHRRVELLAPLVTAA